MIPQHRQWTTRSYAVAETVAWATLALSLPVGDLANQWYEGYQHTGGLHRMGGQAGGLTP